MKSENLAQIMLNASFRESELFWKRHGAFSITQAVLAGFAGTDFMLSNGSLLENFFVVLFFLGLTIAIGHLHVLASSEFYNGAWFQGLCHMLEDETEEKESFAHLLNTLHLVDRLDRKKILGEAWKPRWWEPKKLYHSSKIAMFVPVIFLLFWVACGVFFLLPTLNN